MLRVMFEQHPDIAVPPESYFPIRFLRQRDRYERGGGFDLGVLADDLLQHERFRAWRLDEGMVREHLQGVANIDYADALRRVYALYAEAHGKERYGDKTPPFLMHMRTLAELFSEARFVHLVRDGRDVVLSLRDQPFAPHTWSGAAAYWADRVRKGRRAGEKLGAERYLEIRYEDLVAEPEMVLRRVCEFAELEFRPEMLSYSSKDLANIPLGAGMRRSGADRPPAAGRRDWRGQMSAHQLAVVEFVAGADLEAFGYALAGERATTRTRASVAAGKAWERTGGRTARRIKQRSRPAAR
jgi:hypothetical protein